MRENAAPIAREFRLGEIAGLMNGKSRGQKHAEVTGGKDDVVIQCRGRVVRTDEPNAGAGSGDNRGVACVIDSYEFVRNS